MKIAYLTAGAAGMYCGSCLHDNNLARTLIRRGVDITLIPCYTPIRTDEVDVSQEKVFLTGINVYLQQKFAFFRHTPRFFDKIFESRRLLKWISKLAISTDARDLGELSLAVIEGEQGKLAKEIDKLVIWLRDELKPDLVQLPNAMLVGFARRIRSELGVPVLCAMQGEDLFIDDLVEPYKSRALASMAERCAEVDGFIVPSAYYKAYMSSYLQIPLERIHHVPLGLNLEDHGKSSGPKADPFTIGFLGRTCPEKGLHCLIDAFHQLADRVGKEQVRLKVAGYLSAKDRTYYAEQQQKIREWGLADRVDFLGEVDREQKLALLKSIDVFSMPAPYKEPKGLSLLEAMANGIPVVQPDHGAFSELVEKTGGGLLVPPNDPEALTAGLLRLLEEPDLRRQLGQKGKEQVHEGFGLDLTADRTLAVYERVKRTFVEAGSRQAGQASNSDQPHA